MGHRNWNWGVWGVAFGLAIVGCSGSSSKQDGSTESSVCAANTRRCDGSNVKLCSADGTSESIETTCLAPQACSDGACRDTACVPNARFCKEGAIWKCDSAGAGSALADTCPSGFYCRQTDDDASCSTQSCSANAPMCDGTIATTCQIDGSGPKPGGTNCAETKQACYEGQCRDSACQGGKKLCQQGDVYLCAENGTATSLLVDCRDSEVCDGAEGACRPKVCEPGKQSCDGSRIVTCNEFGSAWLVANKDCAAESKVCTAGSCQKQVCTPGSSFCQDGDVFACDSTGVIGTLSQSCSDYWQHCAQYSTNYAYCESNQCHAGDVVCDGNLIKTCTADSTLPSTGTDCGNDNYCENGECKPRGCDPVDQYVCKDGDIYYCGFSGASLQQQCPEQTACKSTGSGATCEPLPCEPGSVACLADKLGSCATDGKSLSKVTEDCSASGNVCTADLKCGKSAVDTLAVAETLELISPGYFVGDAIEVNSARKLTELSFKLVTPGPRELRWVIYEQTGQTFTARLDKIVSNVVSTGTVSSGPFNYALKANKRYVVGLVLSGGDGAVYTDAAPFGHPTSFGNLLGRVNIYYQSVADIGNLYTEYAYQMGMSTEAP